MKKVIIFLAVFIFGTNVFAIEPTIYKLDDGQTVVIQQVKNNPIVVIDTWVKTGSINENDQNNGVSHFLEHLFFKGTATHPPGDFDKILESKGANTNAATSKDFTHYYIEIPSKYFDLAMNLHADMLLNPLIPSKEMEKERKVVMEEIAKDENNPDDKVYENLIGMFYKTHPYGRKVIGTNQIIGKITRDEILNYYNTHYSPENMITIVIGDVEPQHALDKIKEDFKVSKRKLEKNINAPEKPLAKKIVKVDYQPVQGGYLIIGYRSVNALNSDTYALDVLATILGDGRSSKLYQAIKEQKQLAYSISASNATYREDGIFEISANFVPNNSEKLQKAIFEEVGKVRKEGITQEELNLAKSIIERDTYYSRESVSNIASEIGYMTILSDNPKYYSEYLTNIKKVTTADVKRVADKYLSEGKSATSIVLPLQEKNKSEISATPTVSNPTLIKDTPATKKYQLANGTTVLVTPNDLNDIVAVSIYIKGGEFFEKIPGVAEMTASVMLKGTQKYSSLELAKIMEEKGIKISPSVSADTFTIDILTTKAQLKETLNLLDEVVNNAVFDNSEIEKTRTSKLNSIKNSRDLPMNIALEEYKSLIYEGSIYSNGSKVFEKTFPKIQRDDILDYYGTIFNPKNIVVSANGDVNINDLTPSLDSIFHNPASVEFNYADNASQIPYLSAPKTSMKKIKNLKTAWLILGWQVPGVLSQKDCATLQVIDSMLGTGMSSRLFKDLREQEGLAYQLGSSYSPKILRGSFTVFIGTNPKTLSLSEKMVFVEINRLKTEFVSDKELQEAKDKILGKYVLSQETNLEKASVLARFESSGRGFEFKNKYEELINSVTASDIIEVSNKYLNSNYVKSVVDNSL